MWSNFNYQHVQRRCVCYEFRNVLKASNHRRQCSGCPANHSITTIHDLHNNPFWLRSKCQKTTAQVVPSLQNGATVMLSCTIILRNRITAVIYSRFIMHISHWPSLDTSSKIDSKRIQWDDRFLYRPSNSIACSPELLTGIHSNMTAASKHLICLAQRRYGFASCVFLSYFWLIFLSCTQPQLSMCN